MLAGGFHVEYKVQDGSNPIVIGLKAIGRSPAVSSVSFAFAGYFLIRVEVPDCNFSDK